jgi:hypothetical protein
MEMKLPKSQWKKGKDLLWLFDAISQLNDKYVNKKDCDNKILQLIKKAE